MYRITKTAMSILAIGSIALAACGGDDDAGSSASEPSSDVATTDAPTSESTAAPVTTGAAPETTEDAGSAPLIEIADTELGPVIVAADGLTLYVFTPDSAGEPTCTGGCAGNWPPYYVEGGAELTAGDGLDPALLSVVAHPDGGEMLRYGDSPLYYFAGDRAPGDTNGQGVNDVWWVLDGSGAPIQNAGLTEAETDANPYDY